mmetsp:Transcript_42649/g.118723  ORF Transcript_42649/g.118723 Transcript_42649/m.118723 type:complete len:239 (-) Transcript_42649:55-771(-)
MLVQKVAKGARDRQVAVHAPVHHAAAARLNPLLLRLVVRLVVLRAPDGRARRGAREHGARVAAVAHDHVRLRHHRRDGGAARVVLARGDCRQRLHVVVQLDETVAHDGAQLLRRLGRIEARVGADLGQQPLRRRHGDERAAMPVKDGEPGVLRLRLHHGDGRVCVLHVNPPALHLADPDSKPIALTPVCGLVRLGLVQKGAHRGRPPGGTATAGLGTTTAFLPVCGALSRPRGRTSGV